MLALKSAALPFYYHKKDLVGIRSCLVASIRPRIRQFTFVSMANYTSHGSAKFMKKERQNKTVIALRSVFSLF